MPLTNLLYSKNPHAAGSHSLHPFPGCGLNGTEQLANIRIQLKLSQAWLLL